MARLQLAAGQSAELVASDGERVILLAAEPTPPGSVLGAHLLGDSTELRVKVRGCRRVQQDGDWVFRIEGRLMNLSRAARERLLRALD